MTDAGGRWAEFRLPDGRVRQDWIPEQQPPGPDGGPGEWHIVTDAPGQQGRWEWHPAAPAVPAAPPTYGAPPQSGYVQPHGYGQPQVAGPASLEFRRRALAMAVQREVAAGYRVESQTDESAVMVKGKGTNHVLHLILTIITCGLWGLVWIIMYFVAKERRMMLNVDSYGNVLRAVA